MYSEYYINETQGMAKTHIKIIDFLPHMLIEL